VLDYNSSSSSQHGLFSGGGVYVNFRVSDVTNPGGNLCSPYQLFVGLKNDFFKSKYLPLL